MLIYDGPNPYCLAESEKACKGGWEWDWNACKCFMMMKCRIGCPSDTMLHPEYPCSCEPLETIFQLYPVYFTMTDVDTREKGIISDQDDGGNK